VTARVLVIGGSNQGRQTIDALEIQGDHLVVGVVDGNLPRASVVVGYPVVGAADDVRECAEATRADGFIVAIGDNFARGSLFDAARAACPDLEPVSAIHPSAVVARDAAVGVGVTILAGAVVSNGCRVGAGALLGTNSSLDHDGGLGDFVSLGPGATTGGNVSIGSYTAIGLGANVIHQVTIGSHAVVGAGALVLKDLPDSVVAYGVPARVARRREAAEPYL
jgi:sugar O-acyltransferase (sialic acid O-acetyltransferase NeuD family)